VDDFPIGEFMILRARVVLPISRPPIEDGAVIISGNRIAKVGEWKELAESQRSDVIDLGESILLPGLINAHCHLDYTDMTGLMPPQKSFTDWIRLMLATKASWNYSEYAHSWIQGAAMLAKTGTTTVVDFEAVPELLPEAWSSTPLRVISLMEMTGVKSRRDPRAILQDNVDHIVTLPGGRCRPGLAPHAPYSTVPELVRLGADLARRRRWPLSIHVSESLEEFEMFMNGRGVMFDWLRRNHRDMSDCGHGSPVKCLDKQGVFSENCLAVHVNYLADGDASLLGSRRASVVHCPRSHLYFAHQKFPFGQFTKAGVNVCLGTDSLATIYKRRKQTVELNMFDELRTFAGQHPRVNPKTILQMATVNGARALGMAGHIGEISERALADLIAIPFGGKIAEANEAVVHYEGDVDASLIDGEWAVEPAR